MRQDKDGLLKSALIRNYLICLDVPNLLSWTSYSVPEIKKQLPVPHKYICLYNLAFFVNHATLSQLSNIKF